MALLKSAKNHNTYTKTKENTYHMPKIPLFIKGRKKVQIAIQICISLAIIGTIVIGILLYYHKQTPAVWTTFTTVIFISLAFCLYWQNAIWEKQAAKNDDIKNKLSKIIESQQKIIKNLPPKHVIFYSTGTQFIPYGITPPDFKIFWETGKIEKISSKHITIINPTMCYKNIWLYENKIRISKKIGHIKTGDITLGPFKLGFSVIGIDKDIIIIGMGFFKKK
ncbi:MAG: hypothetical protein ACFFCW_24095 [Candidatus Hodarchaeota archaeon]